MGRMQTGIKSTAIVLFVFPLVLFLASQSVPFSQCLSDGGNCGTGLCAITKEHTNCNLNALVAVKKPVSDILRDAV